jgi:hypothetical protein
MGRALQPLAPGVIDEAVLAALDEDGTTSRRRRWSARPIGAAAGSWRRRRA